MTMMVGIESQPNAPDREAILQDIYASLQAALEKMNLAPN